MFIPTLFTGAQNVIIMTMSQLYNGEIIAWMNNIQSIWGALQLQ